MQLNVPEIELWKISFKAAIRCEAFKGQDGNKGFIFLLDKGTYSFRCHIPHYDYKGKFRGLKAVTCWTNWTSQIDQSDGSLRCDILSLSAGGPKRPESAAFIAVVSLQCSRAMPHFRFCESSQGHLDSISSSTCTFGCWLCR